MTATSTNNELTASNLSKGTLSLKNYFFSVIF